MFRDDHYVKRLVGRTVLSQSNTSKFRARLLFVCWHNAEPTVMRIIFEPMLWRNTLRIQQVGAAAGGEVEDPKDDVEVDAADAAAVEVVVESAALTVLPVTTTTRAVGEDRVVEGATAALRNRGAEITAMGSPLRLPGRATQRPLTVRR